MTPANDEAGTPVLTRLVATFLRGDVAILLTIVSLSLGGAALLLTPREEEPQIEVPYADVFVSAPGLSATEVERQVATRLEKLLFQVEGVEHVYSMSRPGQAIVTVRFYVGERREDALVRLYDKVYSNQDRVPPAVRSWVIKPVSVDDVPIVNITLWSERPEQCGPFELRRVAEEIQHELLAIRNTNRLSIVAGRPREIRVELDPMRLAARHMTPLQVADALRASNVKQRAGRFEQGNTSYIVEGGVFVGDARALSELVISVQDDRPVYLGDVARIIDGAAEVTNYSWIGFGPADGRYDQSKGALYPAVHVAIAKREGTNAVWVADAVRARMEELAQTHLPAGVHYRVTRDYGETSNEKVNGLVEGLSVAVVTVVALIGVVLGWRSALVIALAIPICYSLTLFVNLLAGYSINRVTMFALILALGLLVDDPITDVENITRYFQSRRGRPRALVLNAVQEVRPALILSTLAVIAAFLPLAFITGMMGPYMAPMSLNVPVAVTVSTVVVAFMITPWFSMVMLRKHAESGDDEGANATAEGDEEKNHPLYGFYSGLLGPVLDRRWASWALMGAVALALLGALVLPLFRAVPVKMLPYDNKEEFQIVVDMPEGTTLEETDRVARRLGAYVGRQNEVVDYEVYSGLSSPMDFNGMIRHYYLRRGDHVADIRVNLNEKKRRAQQSHEVILRIREDVTQLARELGANVKLVEVPPGPPVLATITAEVRGPAGGSYGELIAVSRTIADRLRREPGVVDVDVSAQDEQQVWVFVTDKRKAALSHVSTAQVAETLTTALGGTQATELHEPSEVNPLNIVLRLPRAERSAIDDLSEVYVVGRRGERVQLGTIGAFHQQPEDHTLYHKDLQRIAYVYAEVAGRPPGDAIIDVQADRRTAATATDEAQESRPVSERTWLSPGGGDLWNLPAGIRVDWAGEGEWEITLRVFRDLGIAYAAALVLIFIILMFQTGSRIVPLIIMLAIPLTLIGIMPGFWLLNRLTEDSIGGYSNPVFFTATAMIGMIVLAGIVIRNSVLLIEFVNDARAQDVDFREAVLQSLAVRTRPILLTAATTLVGNIVITLDPVFSGLAWAIIFGIVTSNLFTLIVIPVVYALMFGQTKDGRLEARV